MRPLRNKAFKILPGLIIFVVFLVIWEGYLRRLWEGITKWILHGGWHLIAVVIVGLVFLWAILVTIILISEIDGGKFFKKKSK